MFLVRRLLTAVVFALLAASGAIAHESPDHAVYARTPKVDRWWA
jgi:hypothetical protein